MHSVELAKRVLAVLILICFFLPIAQCSQQEPGHLEQADIKPAVEVLVPAKHIAFESMDEVPLAVLYLWPLLFVAVRRLGRTGPRRIFVAVTEVLLAGGSLYLIVETIKLWGTVRYGGVIVLTAFTAYLLLTAFALYRYLREPPKRSFQTRDS